MRRALLLTFLLAAGCAARLDAQSLHERCMPAGGDYCLMLADAALTIQPRLAIVAAGGNPVPGTASTLGMRLPAAPRWSLAVRATATRVTIPPYPPLSDREGILTPWNVSADASAGVFNGFHLLPTIGGFASLDVLGSIGLLTAGGDVFEQDSRVTWALGGRVGILRESFTAPGVSLSAMYRSVPGTAHGNAIEVDRQQLLSLRGTVGKRILGFGLTGGVAWDRGSGDVRVSYLTGVPPSVAVTAEDDVTWDRTALFGNLSWTWLVLNASAELGWQSNDDVRAGAHEAAGNGGLFGGLAVRLAL
ncbi:MAG TPA: hypothetical protein VFZ69_17005 [Longimicrobiales bacterium]